MKKLISLVLALALCFSLAVPALAVNETNTMGITFSASLDKSELTKSDADQSVVLTVVSSSAVATSSISYTADVAEGLSLISLEGDGVNVTDATTNLNTGKFSWSATGGTATSVTTIAKVTINVPAGTAAGTYNVGITGIQLSTDYGMTIIENGAGAYATLTITDDPAATYAYTAAISADKTEINVNDTVTVTVNVDGTAGSFASSQIKMSYDPTYLTFDAASTAHTLNGASVSEDTSNVITIVDHGEAQQNGEAYKLAFTGKAVTATDTAVTLTGAGFDKAENAAVENLINAKITTGTVSIAVKEADLNVSLSDDFTSEDGETVAYGGTYTFTAKDPNYNYTVSVNDGAITPTYDAATGKWTITNVTTDLTITATKTAKQFKVTISDMDAINVTGGTPATGENAATYKQPYTFTLKDDVAMSAGVTGYTYTVESITIGGQTVTGSYSNSGRVYTINGDYITGDIVITTKVTTTAPNMLTVTMQEGVSELVSDKTEVESSGTVTLTLTPVAGYNYEIKVNGVVKTPDADNKIVMENVTENLVVTVSKTLDLSADNVTVSTYLSLDAKTIYLVQVSTKLDSGNVYTYGGQTMYWSEKYNTNSGTNAFLVIMDNQNAEGTNQILDVATAITQIDISTGTSTAIDYSGNVNMADASTVDANDAQLVYNMYQTKSYSEFSTNVTMEKFLRADVNASGNITVEDATAIVKSILGN